MERLEEVTLREHLESRVNWLEKLWDADKGSVEKRLAGMNEFREALRDQNALMFPRAEHEAFQKLVNTKIESLQASRAEMEGKASQSGVNLATALALAAVCLSLLDLLLRVVK